MKIALFGISIALAALLSSATFAGNKSGGHDCCASKTSQSDLACIDYASLNLTADQKSKIEAWQAECTKAGCTKESRAKFLKQAKEILSADQYAKLKTECNKSAKKTEA